MWSALSMDKPDAARTPVSIESANSVTTQDADEQDKGYDD
jgi:hypothetical protein